jgi:hypothetical protein
MGTTLREQIEAQSACMGEISAGKVRELGRNGREVREIPVLGLAAREVNRSAEKGTGKESCICRWGMAAMGRLVAMLSLDSRLKAETEQRFFVMVQALSKSGTSGSVQMRFVLRIGWPRSLLLAVG